MEVVPLPLGATAQDNHTPILVSKDIGSKKRVIVFFGERHNELGILSLRVLSEEGINVGCAASFIKAVEEDEVDAPGIILANPGQLLWYRGEDRAVTRLQWINLPRESAIGPAMRIDDVKNTIPGNKDYDDHLEYIFENVLTNIVSKEAKINVIAMEWCGTALSKYLESRCKWSNSLDRKRLTY